jgi:ATP-dependent DNA helicase DinG
MTLKSFVAVDTETTGLDFEQDRMIELAAVRFEDGKPVAQFEALFATDRALSPVSRLITGLTPEQLEAAPPAKESLRLFLEFAGDLPLVAHNAEFDAHFVRRALEAEGLPPLPGAWIDSLLLSRAAWPASESHRLDSLAAMLELSRDDEHRALPDARRCGEMFAAAVRALTVLSPRGRERLTRLAAALPDWSRVFPEGFAEGFEDEAGVASAASLASLSAGEAPAFSPEVDARASELALDALGREAWLAVETPRGLDETATALAAAGAAAAKGQRVLLCVPDNFAWNGVRKSAAFAAADPTHPSLKRAALAEPSGYLNRARLDAWLEHPDHLPAEERAALLPLAAWADRASLSVSGLLADGRGFSPERARLATSRVNCETYGEDPGAKAARGAAESAGVILVTHATLCAHLRLEGALLPACDSLVVAGAHRLPELAQRALGREVTFPRLRACLQLLRHSAEHEAGLWTLATSGLGDDARAAWAEKWFEPERQLQKFLQKAGRHAAKRRPAGDSRVRYAEPAALAFGADPAPVLEALRENEAFLAGLAAPSSGDFVASEARRLLERLRSFRLDFEHLCDARDAEEAYWFEDVSNPHKASLRSAPVDPEAVGARLRDLFGAGVFLSPALLTGARGGDDAGYFARALGLASGEASLRGKRSAPAPEAGARPPRFLMAPFAPGFSSTEPPEGFARFLAEAAAPFAGRGVAIFFPSQSALRTVHAALKAVLPPGAACWAQHVDGNRDAVLRLYASGRGGFVLVTEGVPGLRDADGRAPALFLVTRMPLPPAHDPLLEARGEIVKELGRNARAELWHPAAVLRVKREWSALHRGDPAAGPRALWLLDARASAEGLGAQAGRALGCEPETVADVAALQDKTREALGPEGGEGA